MMDLNYARDTTSGEEGLNVIPQIQALDPSSADRRHDGMVDCGRRGRGDEARRA